MERAGPMRGRRRTVCFRSILANSPPRSSCRAVARHRQRPPPPALNPLLAAVCEARAAARRRARTHLHVPGRPQQRLAALIELLAHLLVLLPPAKAHGQVIQTRRALDFFHA